MACLAELSQAMVVVRQRRKKTSSNGDKSGPPERRVLQLDHTAGEVVIDGILGKLHRDHRNHAHPSSSLGGDRPWQLVLAELKENGLQQERGCQTARHCRQVSQAQITGETRRRAGPVEIYSLDIAMTDSTAISGWNDWRYHIAEKSPKVQPTRHRNVLTPARFQVGREAQKSQDSTGGGVGCFDLLQQDGLLTLCEDVGLEKGAARVTAAARVSGHGLTRSDPGRSRRTERIMVENWTRPRQSLMPLSLKEEDDGMDFTAATCGGGDPRHLGILQHDRGDQQQDPIPQKSRDDLSIPKSDQREGLIALRDPDNISKIGQEPPHVSSRKISEKMDTVWEDEEIQLSHHLQLPSMKESESDHEAHLRHPDEFEFELETVEVSAHDPNEWLLERPQSSTQHHTAGSEDGSEGFCGGFGPWGVGQRVFGFFMSI
ncbi:hypothetical protein CPLU01_09853 [Colletotrichum plurivorum]|uniref:Uncharacterized protein n=1 Tax=Colletotrichum plurivorum TaxID=2175906 RepID=A0A8H6K8F5_9PEZI|nr:hypothetical protein CPLU01_09853 [Colletotrichum plurivorum]